jgi:hypothetical protein
MEFLIKQWYKNRKNNIKNEITAMSQRQDMKRHGESEQYRQPINIEKTIV